MQITRCAVTLIVPLLLMGCHNAGVTPETNKTASVGQSAAENIDPTKTLFPMANYPQSVDKWLPSGPDAQRPVIDAATQQRYFSALKSRYFGMNVDETSPWNPHHIRSLLSKGTADTRDAGINAYLSSKSLSWGSNFRTHSDSWKQDVRNNAQTAINMTYQPSARGIAIRETLVRVLPTDDPAYSDPRLAGQGYPFDNLQASSIRSGTPVYVLTHSSDKRWNYVVSPTVTGWVHSEDIAGVTQPFVTQWLALAEKNLGTFITEPVSVHDNDQFYFTARPGTILPFRYQASGQFVAAIPVSNSDGNAEIRWVSLKEGEFTGMPWKMTPANIATLMTSMSGRPYGWGNYNFYNDCSAEMRSLLMPFGIFLPRNSAAQVHATTRVVDLSKEDINTRINYLRDHGKPFSTLIYITGHIMLYIGNTEIDGKTVPMTYQNVWGLHTEADDSRSIIGGSVFFPILASYPENPALMSLAGKAQFMLGFIE